MQRPQVAWRLSLLVFIVGVAYAMGLQYLMRPYAAGGVYFHPWSSEDMMQTVSFRELRHDPWRTLSNIHIQPPIFDAIRAMLAQFWPHLSDQAALIQVDRSLYVIGSILLGALVAVAFLWLSDISGVPLAVVGSLVLLMHPATIFFATYLDSTLLSAFLILCFYYLLWKFRGGQRAHMLLFSFTVVMLFFTRSIFQWPAMAVIAISLLLLRVSGRQLLTYVVITGALSGPYLAKQQVSFGLFSTSSFTGLSLSNSIGVGMGSAKYAAFLDEPGHPTRAAASMPGVLTDKTKLGAQTNFNHIDYLDLNNLLLARYRTALGNMPVSEIAAELLENAEVYFRPSSSYSSGHVIVEHLPWRAIYDRVFSAPILPLLLLVALIGWSVRIAREASYRTGLGLLIPGLFVFLVCIVSDKGENMRFKVFLEPVMIVFLVSQFSRWFGLGGSPLREYPGRS